MIMGDILFVTWDGGGNVPPAVGIATELQRRGEIVRMLGHEQQRGPIEGAGLRFEPYSHPHTFSSTTPKPWLRWWRSSLALVNDRSLGVDLLASVQRESTDLVVIDCALPTVLRAAEQSRMRRAVLVHSFYSMGAWSMGSDGPIARLRGRPPTKPWGGAEVGLIATLRSLDPDGDKTLPSSIRFTGPVWQGTPRPAPQPDGQPRILVSLSSVSFPGQERVLQNILDAVGGLPLSAVVTAGLAVPTEDLRVPANAELHAFMPHADVLPTVSMVIGHGGHATTMAALSHDLPVIVLPMAKFMDQLKIGQALEKVGAGRLLPKRSSPARIQQAIEQVLGDKRYRSAASQLGAQIRQRDGASTAADAITEILANRNQTDDQSYSCPGQP
jgi:UDP:flavonoid glycosyltransferase YjiC (YdhE family)